MDMVRRICLVVILILSWSCFVEEIANYFFLYRADRTRFRMWVFFAIGVMDAFLLIDYYFIK